MPVEIKELVIRAVAETRPSSPRPAATAPAQPAAALTADERRALVMECVREVMRRLERSRARSRER